MKGFKLLLATAVLVSSAASATKIPIPIEGATLNVSAQFQPNVLFAENGAASGTDLGTEFYLRRARLLVNGDVSNYFTYLYQIDMPNAGKRGNYPTQANGGFTYVQDAWIGFAPTGITGPNVVYIDAGILLQPISRHLLVSTTNFMTADVHTDSFRIVGGMPGLRDPGIQVRGWLFDKKVGFRGGVYEGVRGTYLAPAAATGVVPAPANNAVNIKNNPRFAGFVNIDILGSEEGAWLYQENYWAKEPILSVGGSANYQAQSVLGPAGITDNFVGSVHAFTDIPFGENLEVTAQAIGYRSTQGKGSRNTGFGGFIDAGVRIGNIKPYASYEAFVGDSCPDDAVASACTGPTANFQQADTRATKVGVNYFIDRNRNHIYVEYSNNHGQVAVAPVSQFVRDVTKSQNTVLIHWNLIF